MKKTHKDFILWLDAVAKKWHPTLCLGAATVEFRFDASIKYMECTNRYPYLDHVIKFNEKAFDDWLKRPEEMEENTVHELCHIITDPLYCKATNRYATSDEINDEREKLTDYMARIVLKLHSTRP